MSALSKEEKNPLNNPISLGMLLALVGSLVAMLGWSSSFGGKIAAVEASNNEIRRGQELLRDDVKTLGAALTSVVKDIAAINLNLSSRMTDHERRLIALEARAKEAGK